MQIAHLSEKREGCCEMLFHLQNTIKVLFKSDVLFLRLKSPLKSLFLPERHPGVMALSGVGRPSHQATRVNGYVGSVGCSSVVR